MKKFLNNMNVYMLAAVISFVLPFTVMLSIFIVRKIYPFGGRSFLHMDMYHQYMPFFAEFVRSIRRGESITFTWNVGIGSNYLALYVYYLASPLHWLAFLVPDKFLLEFLSYLCVVKTGLCGLTSFLYLSKHGNDRFGKALFFSFFYALSGFMAAYNWNIMWLDCVILLPLIVLGLERLVEEGKTTLYCITLALCIFTNFYISIMVCIFLVLYFAVLFFTSKMSWRAIRQFAMYSLLAGGMAAILLIPEVKAIMATDFGTITFPKKFESYFSVLDMLARHCMGVYTEKGLDHWPNIYCGVVCFILIPVYAMNDKIAAKKRFGMMALSGFMLFSFSTNVLNFIWHGLNYPDSLPARQSFIYILLILTMCYDGFRCLEESRKKLLIQGYLIAVAFLLFVEKFITHDDFKNYTAMLNIGFVTIYAVLFYLLLTKKGQIKRLVITLLVLIALITEGSINTMDTSISTVSRNDYLGKIGDYQAIYEKTKEEEDGFYRIEKFERKTKNDGTLAGYPTASVFSSTLNSSVMQFYKKLGMQYSKVYYSFDGATAWVSALLNVQYMVAEKEGYENELYEAFYSSNGVNAYRNTMTLPFGYVAPYEYDFPQEAGSSTVDFQNRMIHALGIEENLLVREGVTKSGEELSFTARKDAVYYAIVRSSKTKKLIVTGGSPEEQKYKDLKYGEIIYLGHLSAGDEIIAKDEEDSKDDKTVKLEFYYLNMPVLQEALEILGENSMQNVTYTNDTIQGHLSLEERGRAIFSIPAEEGWRITVNGEQVEPQTFGDALVALDLEAGEYDISMKYVPDGKGIGIAVTVGSILVYVAILLLSGYFKRKKEKRLNSEEEVV